MSDAISNEKKSIENDDPSAFAIKIEEIDGDDGAYVDARTFVSEGLCVCVVPGTGILMMTADQARACAKALMTMADRVASASVTLRGVHDGAGTCSPVGCGDTAGACEVRP